MLHPTTPIVFVDGLECSLRGKGVSAPPSESLQESIGGQKLERGSREQRKSQCHLHLSPLAMESDIGRPLYARLVSVHLRVAAPIKECAAVDERLFDETDAVVVQVRDVY